MFIHTLKHQNYNVMTVKHMVYRIFLRSDIYTLLNDIKPKSEKLRRLGAVDGKNPCNLFIGDRRGGNTATGSTGISRQ